MLSSTGEAILCMSPTDFEKYSIEIISQQVKGLPDCRIQHNKIIKVDDGNYQIDGYIEFSLMGIKYKTLIECKYYKSRISREKVQILYDKIRACGAHKGILVSSSDFQAGAIEYASKHGIALIKLTYAGTTGMMVCGSAATGLAETLIGIVVSGAIMVQRIVKKRSNDSCPYIEITLSRTGNEISHSYLSGNNLSLKEFLEIID